MGFNGHDRRSEFAGIRTMDQIRQSTRSFAESDERCFQCAAGVCSGEPSQPGILGHGDHRAIWDAEERPTLPERIRAIIELRSLPISRVKAAKHVAEYFQIVPRSVLTYFRIIERMNGCHDGLDAEIGRAVTGHRVHMLRMQRRWKQKRRGTGISRLTG